MDAADRIPALRKAHALRMRFHRAGQPAPLRVRVLDARYRGQFRQPRQVPQQRRRPPTGSPAVAAAIQQAREAAAMSRGDLAAAVGVTQAAVRNWEGARRTPGAGHWVQLELALGPLGVVRDARPEAVKADHERAA
jgi:ribosome-binding protein aMBF1 (putative translation factor)